MNNLKNYIKLLFLLLFFKTVHANPLQAGNDTIGDPLEDYFWYQDFNYSIGAGAGFVPEFPGANTYTFSALPVIDLNYKRSLFLSTQRGIGGEFQAFDHVTMGARVLYDFGRDNEDYLENMNDLPGSIDGGIFIQLKYAPWVLNLDAQTALNSAGHKGSYGGVSLGYEYQYNKDWQFLPRAGISFADDNYMRAYFGVTPQEAAATGFSVYEPGGGFKDADFAFSTTYTGFESWRIFGTLAAGMLGNEAAESDVVQIRMQYRIFLAGVYIF
jgi:MipA family protein